VIHLWLPVAVAAVLAGAGTYGVLARRNAVLVLIGVELILNAANLLLVTIGALDRSALRAGQVLTLFVITIAAAEICVALAVVLAAFRLHGHIDLSSPLDDDPDLHDDPDLGADPDLEADRDLEAGREPAPGPDARTDRPAAEEVSA